LINSLDQFVIIYEFLQEEELLQIIIDEDAFIWKEKI